MNTQEFTSSPKGRNEAEPSSPESFQDLSNLATMADDILYLNHLDETTK